MAVEMRRAVRCNPLWELIHCSQLIATRLETETPGQLLDEVRRVAIEIPPRTNTFGCVLVRQFIVSVVRALMERAGPHYDALVAARLNALLNSSLPSRDEWRSNLLEAIDECCRVLSLGDSTPPSLSDSSVTQILNLLDERFRDSTLSLSVLANQLGLSPWHIVRLLRTHTGQGFVGHLRARRVAEATRLLQHTRLSGKQIAAEVGYRQARQLGRDFRHVCNTTPTAFRKSLLPQRASAMASIQRFPAKTGQR